MNTSFRSFLGSFASSRRAVLAVTLGTVLSGVLHAQMPANAVLQSLELGGRTEMIKWTNFTYDNPGLIPHTDSTGTGSIRSINAMQATSGFYSWTGDFGFTAQASTSAFAIKSVVLQSVMMRHPNWSLEDHLAYRHTAHFADGDTSTVDGENYNFVPALAALDSLVDGYAGGPVLTYTTDGNVTASLTATLAAVITGPMYMETGAFAGNYYSFAWQWDLSSVAGSITSISVTLPIIVHSSTIGAQLDIGDTYIPVLAAVPEPAICTVAAGLAVLALCGRRAGRGRMRR